MADAYAGSSDLEVRWRPLTDQERTRADVLLGSASRRVRVEVPTLPARVASGEVEPETVTDVVCAMVQRAMSAPVGASQSSVQVGQVQQALTFVNPAGDLYLTSAERALLAPRSAAGKAFTIAVG